MGQIDYSRKASEIDNIVFRRSIYFVQNLRAGDLITADAVKSIRPGFGLPPKMLNKIIGRKLLFDVKFGQAVTLEVIEKENN
jgi:N-acetylneuraminate synthase